MMEKYMACSRSVMARTVAFEDEMERSRDDKKMMKRNSNPGEAIKETGSYREPHQGEHGGGLIYGNLNTRAAMRTSLRNTWIISGATSPYDHMTE